MKTKLKPEASSQSGTGQGKAQGDIALLAHRMLHFGMTYGDYQCTAHKPPDFGPWSEEVATMADRYADMGHTARQGHQIVTAVHYGSLASSYYHFAQLFLPPAVPTKQQYRQKSRTVFSQIAPLLDPPAERIEIPFGEITLPGYLRVAAPGAPCVLFINGLDSAKEVELFRISEHFLQRGMSVFFFDGPGQGELRERLKMDRTNFEAAVRAIIDGLTKNERISAKQFGIFGVSFGGYLCLRAAASDKRLRAVISLCGPYDYRLAYYPPIVLLDFVEQFGIPGAKDMDAFRDLISLKDIEGRINIPAFIAIGERDHLFDERQKELIAALPKGEKHVLRVPDGEHVCSSRHSEILPQMADWMAAKLCI